MRHIRISIAGVLMAGMLGSLTPADALNLEVKGRLYTNVVVQRVEPDGISYSYQGGLGKFDFEELPPEIQKQYAYDMEKARAYKTAVRRQRFETRRNQEIKRVALKDVMVVDVTVTEVRTDGFVVSGSIRETSQKKTDVVKRVDALKGPGLADRSMTVRQTVSQSVGVERPIGSFYLEGLPDYAVKGTVWAGKVYPAGIRNGLPIYATSIDAVPALVNPQNPAATPPLDDRAIEAVLRPAPDTLRPAPTGSPPVSVVVTTAPPLPLTDVVWVASRSPSNPAVELASTSVPPGKANPPTIATPVPAPPPPVVAAPRDQPKAGFLVGFYHGLSSPLRVFKLRGMGFAPVGARGALYPIGLTIGCLFLVLAILVLVDKFARVDPES